jgi:hypothetical protein
MDFSYRIPKDADFQSEDSSLCTSRSPVGAEVVMIHRDENDNPTLLANKNGWLYLAKLCVEMAHAADVDPEFHLHRSKLFEASYDLEKDSIGFCQIAPELENKILASRTSKK